jgi:hypothetical protein
MRLPKLLCLLFVAGVTTSALGGTSEENRKDKHFLIYGDPVGFGPLWGPGGAFGLFLGQNRAIEVGAKMGGSCMLEECQYQTYLFDARLKLWVANSFFVNLGWGLEHATWNASVEPYEDENAFKVTALTTGPIFSIGNLWQIGGFLIGVDWIGFYVPRLVKKEFKEYDGYDHENRDDDEETAEREANTVRPLFLRLHLGAAW